PPHRHPHPFPTRRSSDLGPVSGGITNIDASDGASSERSGIGRRDGVGNGERRASAKPHTPNDGTVVWYGRTKRPAASIVRITHRSEEHTSELQSRFDLVC